MGRRLALLGLAGAVLGGAATLAVVPNAASQAASSANSTFIVPANDGYGVGDCALVGGSCGQVVANQWCEAQGFARASSFGVIDPADVTGALEGQRSGRPISITCAD